MMRRIVLLAPNGQVGFELQRSLAPLGQLFCLSRADVDFSDTAATSARVLALQPDLIVNAAAWTAVDKAETEQDAAYLLNAALPAALAAIARQQNCWLCIIPPTTFTRAQVNNRGAKMTSQHLYLFMVPVTGRRPGYQPKRCAPLDFPHQLGVCSPWQ